ncbi:MAG TPA: biosynthetic-type acetolactate synthase large subunit [Methylomusa anaerophila]|uniref:Acetolactate synthase n=1 Tax=Methylomusa anaerophila TaxID=1930071 RepID=A0A348AFW0_9FIRM|nr:biosynthetic-type acetolactate synthase large subunit [Methylomusa anaerophila]BBB89958.1 acetolactate synthase isozyme 3 large subunit [Methylomusa anaerophila]HML88315.1 biosynthetic-type acetolactate synthase large subunit [Methylomusa anaerophila]
MIILGAEAIVESLKHEGVEVVFGYPGGSVLTLYDAIYKASFPHILTRHEQGAVHAADGYARATGKTGVCFATSGPGGTNLVTGIATAYMDSIPLVAITGQVGLPLIGKDSFQEADICGITTPITKHNYLVKKVQELPRVLREAFYIARTGRPGPVVVDISRDVFNTELDYEYPATVQLRGYSPLFAGDPASIDKTLAALKQAQKPVVFVGGGVILSGTSQAVRKFADITGLPVITSLMGLGCIPCDTPQHLGMVGMHGSYAANMATAECDLLLGIGVRFDDRVTGLVRDFAPKAKVVHFDIDRAEVNKNVRADLKVIGDLRWSLPLLCEKASAYTQTQWRTEIEPWLAQVQKWKQEKPLTYNLSTEKVMPQEVIEKMSRLTQGDAVIVTDVGQHQMWTAQYYTFKKERSLLTSGGLGTMGYGLPAAIGAQLGLPDKTVVLFTGDGSIMMNCQEMATAADNRLPVKIIVLNNQVLGMVNQWQRMFYGERYSHSSTKGRTDFVKLAEAMGVTGFRVTKPAELTEILEKALWTEGPVLVDVLVPQTEDVLPMVPPGGRLDQMILGGMTG